MEGAYTDSCTSTRIQTRVVPHAPRHDDVNILLSTADLVFYGSFHEEQAFPAISI